MPVRHIAGLPVLLEEFLDGLGHGLAEGALVRAALGGVLAVDEAVVLLAVVVGVGDGHLDVVADQVDDGIQRLAVHLGLQQVQQAVLALETSCRCTRW
jgi:6,7-dimethyl-8-ribityllumazine synthase